MKKYLVAASCTLAISAAFAQSQSTSVGQVVGTVKFYGAAPQQQLIDMSKDPGCSKLQGSQPAMIESVVIGAEGGLANAVIYVSGGPANFASIPSEPAQLDQRGCRFIPHVLAVNPGQHVKIANSDFTSHNVHPLPTQNPQWNKSAPPGASPFDVSWANEEAIPIRCNIHPWMLAYVFVVKGPYAVSDSSGAFALNDLPPGSYTLTLWHETYGTQTQNVTVTAGNSSTVNFAFGTPPSATQAATDSTNSQTQCKSLDQPVQINDEEPSGAGHCAGEADFYFTNVSGQMIDCAVIFHKNGQFDPNSVVKFTLSPGQKLGGPGKISTCGADSAQMQYQCFSHGSERETNSCIAEIRWQQ